MARKLVATTCTSVHCARLAGYPALILMMLPQSLLLCFWDHETGMSTTLCIVGGAPESFVDYTSREIVPVGHKRGQAMSQLSLHDYKYYYNINKVID